MTLSQRVIALSPTNRKALAATLLLAGISFIWFAMARPAWLMYRSQTDWRAAVTQRVARDRGLLEADTELRKQLQSMPTSSLAARLYPAGNVSMAENLLQADLATILKESHVGGQTVSQIASKEVGALYSVGLRFSVSMTIDQLEALMAKIAQHRRFLHVGLLDVTAPLIQGRDENASLTVTMEIYGFGNRQAQPAPGSQTTGARMAGSQADAAAHVQPGVANPLNVVSPARKR